MAAIAVRAVTRPSSTMADDRAPLALQCRVRGCCLRCTLRCIGVGDLSRYQHDQDALSYLQAVCSKSVGFSSGDAPGTCVLCLGILPQVADPSIAQQMAHALRATGYQFTDYSIAAITLPLTCTLRQIGMHMHLQQWWQAEVHGPSVADTAASSIPSASEPVTSASSPSIGVVARPISLKDAIRWTLGGSFRNAVNVPCERDSDFRVTFSFRYGAEHGASSAERLLLEPYLPRQYRLKQLQSQAKAAATQRRMGAKRRKTGRGSQVGPDADSNDASAPWGDAGDNKSQSTAMDLDSAAAPGADAELEHALELQYPQAVFDTACAQLTSSALKQAGLSPPSPPVQLPVLEMICERRPYMVGGRYVKLARGLSQTPWVLLGLRKTRSSVQEEITVPLMPLVGSKELKFHSSGREDVDVRMLGSGRRFIIECIDPHRIPSAAELAAANIQMDSAGLVQILDLHAATSAEADQVKESASSKIKLYRSVNASVCVFQPADLTALDQNKEIIIQQRTPVRVLHRRAALIRPRTIHWFRSEYINAHWFQLDIATQAGTYVKEFVHGDRGRTVPSISSLLDTTADILQLDVVGVEGD